MKDWSLPSSLCPRCWGQGWSFAEDSQHQLTEHPLLPHPCLTSMKASNNWQHGYCSYLMTSPATVPATREGQRVRGVDSGETSRFSKILLCNMFLIWEKILENTSLQHVSYLGKASYEKAAWQLKHQWQQNLSHNKSPRGREGKKGKMHEAPCARVCRLAVRMSWVYRETTGQRNPRLLWRCTMSSRLIPKSVPSWPHLSKLFVVVSQWVVCEKIFHWGQKRW